MPSGVEMGQWTDDYTTTYYDQGSHYYPDSAPSFSDPSNLSPRTNWSFEGYARHSPPQQHLHYPAHRPMHNQYPSFSSTASYDERRMSLADSIAASFPEPEMPVPHLYHRYSQPQLFQPVAPPQVDMWMKERSDVSSYGPPPVTRENGPHGVAEHSDVSMHMQRYTPSPLSVPASEGMQGSHDGSVMEDASIAAYNSQVISSEPAATTVW